MHSVVGYETGPRHSVCISRQGKAACKSRCVSPLHSQQQWCPAQSSNKYVQYRMSSVETYAPKVAVESRKSSPAFLKSLVTSKKSASYTLSLFLRSQSPPSSHSFLALSICCFTECQSPNAISDLPHCKAAQLDDNEPHYNTAQAAYHVHITYSFAIILLVCMRKQGMCTFEQEGPSSV